MKNLASSSHMLVANLMALGLMSAPAHAVAKESRVEGSIQVRGVAPKDYPKFAKLTVESANKIASSQVAGKILSTALEREDGYLVYSVEVSTKKGVKEIVIDAGNGTVLSKSAADTDTKGSSENDDD